MLDRFDSGMLTLAIALMGLSILDSLFTLTLLGRGGSELNPVMDVLLQHSVWAFAGIKMLLTAIPAVILVGTGNLLLYNRIRARTVLAIFVGSYAGLVAYEIMLLSLG